jgi:hypothetical protein
VRIEVSIGAALRWRDVSRMGLVWTGIALHTTPGIPQYMHPLIALVTAGVETDVLGIGHSDFAETGREAAVRAYPREEHFRDDIIGVI